MLILHMETDGILTDIVVAVGQSLRGLGARLGLGTDIGTLKQWLETELERLRQFTIHNSQFKY